MTAHDRVGPGYLANQLANALLASATGDSPEAIESANRRVDRFHRALEGLASGAVKVGSRTPVSDLPVWVTLQVVRGGFATGHAAADTELSRDEAALIKKFSLVTSRAAVFRFLLSDKGQSVLLEMLSTRTFAFYHPEQAALLIVAWLLDQGDRNGALQILEHLAPFADRLQFLPATNGDAIKGSSAYFRSSVAEAIRRVEKTKEHKQVLAMRESLLVWNPLLDEFVNLWQLRFVDRLIVPAPAQWNVEASALLERYVAAASNHRRCSKHRKPAENLFVLREAVALELAGEVLSPRMLGRIRCVLEAIERKRGNPESDIHRGIRERQLSITDQPIQRDFAPVMVRRLRTLPLQQGVKDVDVLTSVVAAEEATRTVFAGAPIPRRYRQIIAGSREGTLHELLDSGTIPSAEVLATFGKKLVSGVIARSYADPTLGEVMARNYEAFRKRRSLLLLDLNKQVQVNELPWVQALTPYLQHDEDATKTVLRVLGAMTLRRFPGTLIPNPMTRELASLARQTSVETPFLEELAADIFEGTFSEKFLTATKIAGMYLRGSLYSRYYDIDYEAIGSFPEAGPSKGARTSAEFDSLCNQRTEMNNCGGRWIVVNGATIEQAQILSTHNVAQLLFSLGLFVPGETVDVEDLNSGVRSSLNSREMASMVDSAFAVVLWNLRNALTSRRPLGFVKDMAYAWRQMIVYLCALPQQDQKDWIVRHTEAAESSSGSDRYRRCLTLMLGGLRHCAEGGVFEADGSCPGGRRLVGWSAAPWVLASL
jgi:hypothetical protein